MKQKLKTTVLATVIVLVGGAAAAALWLIPHPAPAPAVVVPAPVAAVKALPTDSLPEANRLPVYDDGKGNVLMLDPNAPTMEELYPPSPVRSPKTINMGAGTTDYGAPDISKNRDR